MSDSLHYLRVVSMSPANTCIACLVCGGCCSVSLVGPLATGRRTANHLLPALAPGGMGKVARRMGRDAGPSLARPTGVLSVAVGANSSCSDAASAILTLCHCASLVGAAGEAAAWETVAALPFVDNARSPPLFRAFYLPHFSGRHNRHMQYVLLRQRQRPGLR